MIKLFRNLKEAYRLIELREFIKIKEDNYKNLEFEEKVKLNYFSYKELLKQIREIIGEDKDE